MKILACLDDPVPASGECVTTAWVEYSPGFFNGWTLENVGAFSAALLVLWAVVVVFRVVHRSAQTDFN